MGSDHSMTWLFCALTTVCFWGLYGVFLHAGVQGMGDPVNGRYKAYLFVGLAYFLAAVLAPLALLMFKGASLTFPAKGMALSLIAGTVGAFGAFFVLVAFASKGVPSVVMSIVFAGAPIVNAIVALSLHPPAGGFSTLRWPFILGIVMAASGGCLVTLFKPNPAPKKAKTEVAESQTSQPSPQVAVSQDYTK